MSYVGNQVSIPAGEAGLNADANELEIPRNALIEAEGLEQVDGVTRKEPGAALLDSEPVGDILAFGAEIAEEREWLAAAALYKSDGTAPEQLGAGMTATGGGQEARFEATLGSPTAAQLTGATSEPYFGFHTAG